MTYKNSVRILIDGFLIFKGFKGIISRVTTLVLILGTTAWTGLSYWGSKTPEMTPEQGKFLTDNADLVYEKIKSCIPQEVKSVCVAYFSGNDLSHIISGTIRNRLSANNDLSVPSQTIGMKTREFLKMSLPAPNSKGELQNWGREYKTDAVISGSVDYDPNGKKDNLRIKWTVTETNSGNVLGEGDNSPIINEKKNINTQKEDKTIDPGGSRPPFVPGKGALWLLSVLIFPILTFKFLENIVKKESNTANLTSLFVYTLIDMIVCSLLIPFNWYLTFSVAVFIILTIFCFFYNVFIFSLALKKVS